MNRTAVYKIPKCHNCPPLIKFIYSEKATKFCLMYYQSNNLWRFRKNFVAFSEYMNFNVEYARISGFYFRPFCASSGTWPACWPPLSKSDPTKEEKTADFIFPASNLRTGKAVSQTEILGIHRKSHIGKKSQDDGRSSQNLVSK